MAKKKSGYSPRNTSLPSTKRDGKLLAKIVDMSNSAVACCWFCENNGAPLRGIRSDDSHYFVFDFRKRNINIDVYVDIEEMSDAVEKWRGAPRWSIRELAENQVDTGLKTHDDRYDRWKAAFREIDIKSISDHVGSCNLDDSIQYLINQMFYCCGHGYGDDDEAHMAAYMKKLYYAELDIRSGKHFVPISYINYAPGILAKDLETYITNWPNHKLRIGYKPFVDGVQNSKAWQLLAQIDCTQFDPDEYPLGSIDIVTVSLTVSDKDVCRLLGQIEYCLKRLES